ncbi:histidine kinase/DNA gyrase B/HSP90-like ATPase [Luteibacter sp. OK325]|uniref:ATP-binding protein n=1 Tax=Luteibacter sp. OK325 TaxID=2135670 RepID=UPI000D36F840|nr:ATP-binding protein [Luteibacter sp. OK325]PTR30758.1 histidine kinase/DNA gyrase B/HSP90-like ATPase [Luteibacter sp. OK325]
MRFYFPTCDDSERAHELLSHVFVRVSSIPRAPITFDFSGCGDLRPAGLVILAGMSRQLRLRGIRPNIDITTMTPKVYSQFTGSGCRSHLFSDVASTQSTLFRHDETEDEDAIISFLRDQWLGGSRLIMSAGARDTFITHLWEVYANAFEHGDSGVGVYTCGEQIGEDTLILTVADFGPGIPANAAQKLRKEWIPGDQALAWAFTRGTTTAANQRYPRGLGLDLLKEFVNINGGRLDIYSHHGHGRVESAEPRFKSLMLSMGATVVQIRLHCDDRLYVLQQELEQQLPPPGTPLF